MFINFIKDEILVKKFPLWLVKLLYQSYNDAGDFHIWYNSKDKVAGSFNDEVRGNHIEIFYEICNEELQESMYPVILQLQKPENCIITRFFHLNLSSVILNKKTKRVFGFEIILEMNEDNYYWGDRYQGELINTLMLFSLFEFLSEHGIEVNEKFFKTKKKGKLYFYQFLAILKEKEESVPAEAYKSILLKPILTNTLTFDFIRSNEAIILKETVFEFSFPKLLYRYYTDDHIDEISTSDIYSALSRYEEAMTRCIMKSCYACPLELCTRKYDCYTIFGNIDSVEITEDMFLEKKEIEDSKLKFLKQLYDKKLGLVNQYPIAFYLHEKKVVGYLTEKLYEEVSSLEEMMKKKLTYTTTVKMLWACNQLLLSLTDRGIAIKTDEDFKEVIVFSERLDALVRDPECLVALSTECHDYNKMMVDLALEVFYNFFSREFEQVTPENVRKNRYFKLLPPIFQQAFLQYLGNAMTISIDRIYREFYSRFFEDGWRDENEDVVSDAFMVSPSQIDYVFEEDITEDDKKLYKLYQADEYPVKTELKTILSNRKKLYDKMGITFTSDGIRELGAMKLVYSSKLSHGRREYKLVGILRKKAVVFGMKEVLQQATNKQFIRLLARILYKFRYRYFSKNFIYVDEDDNIYIDTSSDNINISDGSYQATYIESLIRTYKISGVEELEISDYFDRQELEKLYSELTKFCEIHKIYYRDSEKLCPLCNKMFYFVEGDELPEPIAEDDISLHYRMNSTEYIRLFKQSLSSFDQKIKQARAFLSKKYEVLNEIQHLFLPQKLAVNSQKEGLGYMYHCVDSDKLVDITTFHSKKRVQILLVLCLQVKKLLEENFYFPFDAYQKIYLCRDFAMELQIQDIFYLKYSTNAKELKNAERAFIDFAIRMLQKEEMFANLFSGKKIISINVLHEKLVNLKNDLTLYCSFHKAFYPKSFHMCPLCKKMAGDSVRLKERWRTLEEDRDYATDDEKYEGGESFIYDLGNGYIYKKFKEDVGIEFGLKLAILSKIFDKKEILEQVTTVNPKIHFILADYLVRDSDTGEFDGYIIQEVENAYNISCLRETTKVEELGFSLIDILEILIYVGQGISYLHEKANIYIGDLNGCNILVDKNKHVYFIDFDGMGYEDIKPLRFTDGYVDPVARAQGTITMEDDWYSWAIQVFCYLTGVHPFSGIYRDENGRELEILELMYMRYSLLGNHGIEVPKAAKDWNWLGEETLTVLEKIFEEDMRVDITPYLEKVYSKMKPKDPLSKLVVRKVDLGFSNVKEILSPFAYVDENDTLVIKANGYTYQITHTFLKSFICHEYIRVLEVKLIQNAQYACIILEREDDKKTFVFVSFGINSFKCKYVVELGTAKTFISDQYVYMGISQIAGKSYIKVLDLMNVSSSKDISLFKNEAVRAFYVLNDRKFLIVSTNGVMDYIRANSQILCQFDCRPEQKRHYKIWYDRLTSRFLVAVFKEELDMIIIYPDGNYKEFKLPISISEQQFENLLYNKGFIYIPENGGIHMYSPERQKIKLFECEAVTSSSLLQIVENGFRIFNKEAIFEFVEE